MKTFTSIPKMSLTKIRNSLPPVSIITKEPVVQVTAPIREPKTPKEILPPKGKYSIQWQMIVDNSSELENPEYFADSVMRYHERTQALFIEKRGVQILEFCPTQTVPAKLKKKDEKPKCKAFTLSGKKCTLNCVLGGFCSKHFTAKI